jgi:tRNA-binding protein
MTTPVDAFGILDVRVGRISRCEPNAKARVPAYCLWIDFGPLGIRTSSAKLTELYTVEDLMGREIVAAMNLGTRKVAGFDSEVLVLGLPSEDGHVVLISPDRDVPLGGRVY